MFERSGRRDIGGRKARQGREIYNVYLMHLQGLLRICFPLSGIARRATLGNVSCRNGDGHGFYSTKDQVVRENIRLNIHLRVVFRRSRYMKYIHM